jgi:hypothetical protein
MQQSWELREAGGTMSFAARVRIAGGNPASFHPSYARHRLWLLRFRQYAPGLLEGKESASALRRGPSHSLDSGFRITAPGATRGQSSLPVPESKFQFFSN